MSKINIPIKSHFAGDYRLEYDGKYITLFGKDKNYPGFNFDPNADVWYEEMVLVSCVAEIRKASPKIVKVTETHIVIETNKNR